MILLADSGFVLFNFGGIEAGALEIVLTLLAVIAIIAVPVVVISIVKAKRRGEKFVFTTRDITYAAICLALSFALSFFGFSMPMGGTVTPASVLPVAVFCYYFGFRKGSVVCAVYMLLQLTQKPYIVNAWSMILDYLVPYFALSLVGVISYTNQNKMATGSKRFAFISHWGFFAGMLMYIIIRYFSHVLSGVLFWDYSADYGMASWPYSLAYNSFCLVDMAIAAVAGLLLFTSRAFDRTMIDAVTKSRAKMQRSVQSANGCVSAEVDGLDNAYPAAENDK